MRDNRRDAVYLFGALCPDRVVGVAVVMPAANSEAMDCSATIWMAISDNQDDVW